LSFVLRAVGLRGDGEMGVRETLMATGDLRVRAGRGTLLVTAEMFRESLGLATRAANMVAHKLSVSMSTKNIRESAVAESTDFAADLISYRPTLTRATLGIQEAVWWRRKTFVVLLIMRNEKGA